MVKHILTMASLPMLELVEEHRLAVPLFAADHTVRSVQYNSIQVVTSWEVQSWIFIYLSIFNF